MIYNLIGLWTADGRELPTDYMSEETRSKTMASLVDWFDGRGATVKMDADNVGVVVTFECGDSALWYPAEVSAIHAPASRTLH